VVRAHLVIMVSVDIMCQFMTQYTPYLSVCPEPVISVGTKTKFYLLSSIDIEAEEIGVFVRCKFSQDTNREFVLLHNVRYGWVIRKTL